MPASHERTKAKRARPRSTTRASSLAAIGGALCVFALGACDSSDYSYRPSNKARGISSPRNESPSEAVETDDEEEDTTPSEGAREPEGLGASAIEPSAEAEQKPTEEKPPRDFSLELGEMMQGAVSCLAPRAAGRAPASIAVALSVNVMPSGTVSRGEASSSALSPAELACVRGRLEGVRFAPPIEDAPFSVNATITFEQKSPL